MELTSGFTAICHHSGNPSLAPGEHSVPADSLEEGEKIDTRAAAIKTNRQIFYSNSIFSSLITFKEFFNLCENINEGFFVSLLGDSPVLLIFTFSHISDSGACSNGKM